ncbi:MAG: DNA mismatch repair protein MutL [Patescibacteria group bacterium]|nr:MAG: DNA mismatch repair protein MutL [Patescibacteria group bacterium]
MGRIHLLPKRVADKIAAGEVIERPDSVVKELVENAIDAKADEIEIVIEQAGKKRITVIDNGEGIEPDDLEKAVLKHATSKITTEADLENISSLGFRGEALFSIASVSKLIISSRPKTADIGASAEFLESKLIKKEPLGMPEGTIISVENLFFNLPARKKFLKSDVTEFKHIASRVLNYCLTFPRISFKLSHNGKTVFNLKAKDLTSRISEALKLDLKNDFVEFNNKLGDWDGKIFVVKPDKLTAYAFFNYCFVNNRPVNSSLLYSALRSSLRTLYPESAKYSYLIYLNLPYSEYDVNIHPRKEEIKFLDNNKVFSFIQKTISSSLLKKDLIYRQQFKPLLVSKIDRLPQTTPVKTRLSSGINKSYEYKPLISQSFDNLTVNEKLISFANDTDKKTKYLQIFNLFILVQKESNLIIIDQHAADERRIYEQLKQEFNKKQELNSAELLIPVLVKLPHSLQSVCLEHKQELKKLGFSIQEFGFDKVKINSVPEIIKSKDIQQIFLEIVSSLQTENYAHSDRLERIIATMACRSAVKAGDKLTESEVQVLIEQLNDEAFFRFTCPHGRPTAVIFEKKQLEKMFKRRK